MPSPENTRVISGFRPTSDLTVGNYLGAIKPVLEVQEDDQTDLYVFVADMHGLTDHDPREISPYKHEVIKDCLALGIDPSRTTLYMQSSVEAPVTQIANRLSPYVSVAELARTPNLKEKMQASVRAGKSDTDDALKANYALLGYPVLMAADIFSQKTPAVAVGEDQEPHLELARVIARRFNRQFGEEILVEPSIFAIESLRIASLDGKGKMSKTNPGQAILLTDEPSLARKKIKRAATAPQGEWNSTINSHFTVAENTTTDPERLAQLAELKAAHMAGRAVMGHFKQVWAEITEELLDSFQSRKATITEAQVVNVLQQGATAANDNATEVLNRMKHAMTL